MSRARSALRFSAAYPDLPDDAVQVREFTMFNELTEEMMRAEVVIASRFHNLICALRLARPTVSVGYAEKNRHLMEALGLDDYCQDIEHLDASLLVAQVKAAHEEREVLAARIRRGTSDYAARGAVPARAGGERGTWILAPRAARARYARRDAMHVRRVIGRTRRAWWVATIVLMVAAAVVLSPGGRKC